VGGKVHDGSQYPNISCTPSLAHLQATRDVGAHLGWRHREERDAGRAAPRVHPQLRHLVEARVQPRRPLLHPTQQAALRLLPLGRCCGHLVLRPADGDLPRRGVEQQQLAQVGAGTRDQDVRRQLHVLRVQWRGSQTRQAREQSGNLCRHVGAALQILLPAQHQVAICKTPSHPRLHCAPRGCGRTASSARCAPARRGGRMPGGCRTSSRQTNPTPGGVQGKHVSRFGVVAAQLMRRKKTGTSPMGDRSAKRSAHHAGVPARWLLGRGRIPVIHRRQAPEYVAVKGRVKLQGLAVMHPANQERFCGREARANRSARGALRPRPGARRQSVMPHLSMALSAVGSFRARAASAPAICSADAPIRRLSAMKGARCRSQERRRAQACTAREASACGRSAKCSVQARNAALLRGASIARVPLCSGRAPACKPPRRCGTVATS
jgi:hypothetical protein